METKQDFGRMCGLETLLSKLYSQIVLTVVELRSKGGRGRCVRRIGVAVDLKVEAW